MPQDLDAFCRQRRRLFYTKADTPLPDEVMRPRAADEAVRQFVTLVCRRRLAAQSVTVSPFEEQGTFHWLYRVHYGADRPVIVRVNALSDWQRDFPLYLDSWVAQCSQVEDLPALRVYEVDLSRRLCPFDYEILEEADGTSLKTFDDNEDRIQALLPQLGRVVARLHRIQAEGFGLLDIRSLAGGAAERGSGVLESWRQYVFVNLVKHLESCVVMKAVDREESQRIVAAFQELQPLLDDVQPVLLHGDLGSHNVFTDGRDITALIDWEDCLAGDPVFDIAFWATFHPERRHQAFLDGYQAEAILPGDFEQRFWLYFLRIALAKTVVRHRFGLQDRPGRVPASRRIQLGLERIETLVPKVRAA